MTPRTDLVVVGGGIVGLGHAVAAHRRGMSVTLVERDSRPVGASVRNFGHGCVTAQAGVALQHAQQSRQCWLELSELAGFWVGETGTLVVARADDETAVLEQLHLERGDEQVVLLTADETRARSGCPGAVAGAFLPMDLRIDPRAAAPAITSWLAAQPGVTVLRSTSALTLEPGLVRTSRGDVAADQIALCVGHDVDRFWPELAERNGVQRCRLHMLRVAAPAGRRIEPALLTGLSMLRYAALAAQPAAADVRARLGASHPELLEHVVNLMLTQLPNGDLLIGDTHTYDDVEVPFRDEALDDLVLDEIGRLLGVEHLDVRERWTGVYAAATGEFLVGQPVDRVTIASVTSGIGMTTGLGLAAHVVEQLASGRAPRAA